MQPLIEAVGVNALNIVAVTAHSILPVPLVTTDSVSTHGAFVDSLVGAIVINT